MMQDVTIVIDPRSAFLTSDRFPSATRLIKGWPQEVLPQLALDAAACCAMLTHAPKLGDPALRIALIGEARHVGALGRRTHEKLIEHLRAAGLSANQIARLLAQIGLSLGGRSPSEVAVSILAEGVLRHNSKDVQTCATQRSLTAKETTCNVSAETIREHPRPHRDAIACMTLTLTQQQ